jgi:SAM-dependent methyltransferase
MERDAFALMAAAERDHWWFRGRREFIAAAFRRAALPARATILDAGCGSGGNLGLLSEFGTLYGFEYDASALAAAASLGIATVAHGALPASIPFAGVQFDAIGLFDVLEHLEHPVESLAALGARLVRSGALVLTVPAHPSLWGPHDEAHQHYRRYTIPTLTEHLTRGGFRIEYISHMNSLLLPLAVAQRVKERMFGYSVDELTPSPAVNSMLLNIWRAEHRWIPKRRIPLGLSLIAIARPSTGHV